MIVLSAILKGKLHESKLNIKFKNYIALLEHFQRIIHDRSLSWLGTDTSIKRGVVDNVIYSM
jgi:hypothetical protein